MEALLKRFSLKDQVFVITGGAGMLGIKHAEAVMSLGASVVLLDIHQASIDKAKEKLRSFKGEVLGFVCDITNKDALFEVKKEILKKFGRVHGLINNAANNPKVEKDNDLSLTRLENFPLVQWQQDLDVGLTGAFLCSQIFGSHMAANRGGVILNIASDLSVIAPDQRLYRKPDLDDSQQPVKPVTYSVVKTALVGLTRYLATYWADQHVRVNALSPGGVMQNQPDDFVTRLTSLIPMKRMATEDEYHGAIQFLCSDASKYMTGQNIVMDGGRSVW